jgi:hypothetical protein
MPRYENTFFGYFDNVVRLLRAQPLNLGGHAAPSGGSGGPPGGFFGWLPQSRVAYDLTEAAVSGTATSGASLVDNMNHIRYRLDELESTILSPGITVMEEGVQVGTGITVLNFAGDVNVSLTDTDEVQIYVTISGGDDNHPVASGVYGESMTSQIPAVGNHFDVAMEIADASLQVYYNGIRQSSSFYTVDSDKLGFTTTFSPIAGDTMVVDYNTVVMEDLAVIGDGVTVAYLQANYYDKTDVDGFLVGKSDIGHTHTESQITDLNHDATSIQGTPVAASGPILGQALVYNGAQYAPTSISTSIKTIHQQYILTIDGTMSDAGTGTKPLRIYAQEVNGNATIDEVLCSLNTAPASTDVRIDVLLNGVSIFDPPEYVAIPVGNNTATRDTNLTTTTFTKDDYFKIELVQDDATASDLSVHIRFHWSTN